MIPKVCPECGGPVFFDRETGEFICKSCGLVVAQIMKGVVTTPPAPRYVARPYLETLYHLHRETADRQMKKLRWWQIGS